MRPLPSTVLITGAASGIGEALAERLAPDVKQLILWDLNEEGLENTRRRCGTTPCRTMRVDLSDERSVASSFETIAREGTVPDFVFHGAGILHTGDLDHLRIDDCRRDVLVNYMGTVHLIVHASRLLKTGGRIVCVSSVAGLKGMPEFAGYCASKFAVYGFCESVHSDLKRKGIHLSVLCPPAIDTPMVRNLPERPVLYDIFPFAAKDKVIDSIVHAIERRDDFLILVDGQTRLLRAANGIAPRTISRLFDGLIARKKKHASR
jgi:NAD(P)-dependent dehydrogenase (short-subunit alcohol dehydrogenase family)